MSLTTFSQKPVMEVMIIGLTIHQIQFDTDKQELQRAITKATKYLILILTRKITHLDIRIFREYENQNILRMCMIQGRWNQLNTI